MNRNDDGATAPWYKNPAALGLLTLLGALAVFQLVQHWEHAAPYLPWLLILAMPLLHVVGHGGHGRGCGTGHGGHGHGGGKAAPPAAGAETRADPARGKDVTAENAPDAGCCGGHEAGAAKTGTRHGHGEEPMAGGGCCGGHDDAPAGRSGAGPVQPAKGEAGRREKAR